MSKEIETGNFNVETSVRGWRVGHFIKGRANFKTDKTEFQWNFEMTKGTSKEKPAYNRKSSTLVVLIDGEMKIDFPHNKTETVILDTQGDYVFFAPGVCHKWKATKKTTQLSMRWPSVPDDQVDCDH